MNTWRWPTTLAAVILGLASTLPGPARAADGSRAPEAAPPRKALFALIMGVNQSVDRDLPPLRYADDDAARYLDLFRTLGARTYLLARIDANTRRLHPQAAAEAVPPTRAELTRLGAQMVADIAHARAEHVETVLYFIYAGHGNVDAASADGSSEGYITLEDARLSGRDIQALVARAHAGEAHAIIDACYSYFLTLGRGPGGRRRPASGYSGFEALGSDGAIGLLLSTSSARESHEWDALQAGVFSHEVRSGLQGAADANGDGKVSYREMAAFIERANAAIPNERFRPDVFARPPRGQDELVELSGALQRRLEIDGAHHAHYLLEDDEGVRLADFHNGPATTVRLVRGGSGRLFLRRLSDDLEFEIPPSEGVVRLESLAPTAPRARERGAAHVAFSTLFAMPFGQEAVQNYVFRQPPPPPAPPSRWRRRAATGAAIAAGVAVASAAALFIEAQRVHDGVTRDTAQADVARANDRIGAYRLAGSLLLAAGAATGVTAAFLFIPASEHATGTAVTVGLGGTF